MIYHDDRLDESGKYHGKAFITKTGKENNALKKALRERHERIKELEAYNKRESLEKDIAKEYLLRVMVLRATDDDVESESFRKALTSLFESCPQPVQKRVYAWVEGKIND